MNLIFKYLQKEQILIWPFFFIPFLPTLMVIDKLGVYYLYLSILCLTYQLLFILQNEIIFKKDFYLKSPLLICYTFFLVCQIFSLLNAFNIIEGIIEFFQYFTLFNSVLILSYLSSKIRNINPFLTFILLIGLIECLYTFNIFLDNFTIDNSLGRIRELEGFSSNQNFNAFAILSKVPISIYLVSIFQKKIIKLFLYFFLALQFFLIFVIASRASLIGLILTLIILIVLYFLRDKFSIQKFIGFKNISIIIFSFLLSNTIHYFLYTNNTELRVQNRITSLNDDSTNYRLLNYKEAIEGIIDNPLFGVGIGNWKILSIKYAQERIKGYEISKHVHNDFLHITAEIGIIGGLIFISIFITILILPFKQLFNKVNQSLAILLILCLLIYSIDSFFNFPRIRPYSQLNFFVITIIYSWINQNRNNE